MATVKDSGAQSVKGVEKTDGRFRPIDPTVLGNYPTQFKHYLLERNYSKDTIREYEWYLRLLAQIIKRDGIHLADLNEEQVTVLVTRTDWTPYKKARTITGLKTFARFLAERGVAKPVLAPTARKNARAQLREDYEAYLRRQRGLSDRTIDSSWLIAQRFLHFRFGEEAEDLSSITSLDIVRFLQQLTTRKEPLRDKTLSTHLRNFFLYLFNRGITRANLALGVPRVARRYGTRLPRHLTAEQVEVVLRAVHSDTPKGRRDYAMVLLLARLGLRAMEVVAMQLDDIDWRSGEIIVRGKGGRHDRVPLPADVGESLAHYIKSDRKSASRFLFVTASAPNHPFKDGKILNRILQDAFPKTDINRPYPFVGSHLLRHSLATNLVQRGASLEEIGNLLRHRSRASTMVYARVDIEGLRSVAQSWPTAGDAK